MPNQFKVAANMVDPINPKKEKKYQETTEKNVKFQHGHGYHGNRWNDDHFWIGIEAIRRRSDYIIGFITPAIGPNKSKKLTRPIVPTHNLRGKV